MRDHSNRTGGNELGSKELTRGAGVLLAITSLPSSYGIGTLGEAAFQFVDLLVDLKQRLFFCEKQVEFLQKSTLIVQHKQENERKNYVWYLAVLNFCSGFCRLF